jgi:hypothetical protein
MDDLIKVLSLTMIAICVLVSFTAYMINRAETEEQAIKKNFCIQEFKTNAVKYDKCINF